MEEQAGSMVKPMEQPEKQQTELDYTEKPLYVLSQSKPRAILPQVLSLVILGVIFYLGILVNVSLLELDEGLKSTIKLASLIFLSVVVAIGILLAILKAGKKYYFYRNRIAFGRKAVNYAEIINTTLHVDLLDRIFKTHSINLGHKFFLSNIPQNLQIQNYLRQLIDYSKK